MCRSVKHLCDTWDTHHLHRSAGAKVSEVLVVEKFPEESPLLVCLPSARPGPAAPQVDPRKGAAPRHRPHPVVVGSPPPVHSPGEVQLLQKNRSICFKKKNFTFAGSWWKQLMRQIRQECSNYCASQPGYNWHDWCKHDLLVDLLQRQRVAANNVIEMSLLPSSGSFVAVRFKHKCVSYMCFITLWISWKHN